MNTLASFRKYIAQMSLAIAFLFGCPLVVAQDDTLEPINRAVFAFNEQADRFVLKPIAKGYRAVTPDYFEESFSRFFGNLGEIGNTANYLLQAKFPQAGNSASRFLINTTMGVGGLFDPAEPLGFEKQDGEDLGQTLAVWGVDSGPYLVLPLLGPSTLRDGVALVGDYYTDPLNYIEDDATRIGTKSLELVGVRASLLDAEGMISGDRYNFIRDVYLQRREYLIQDGEVEDDFDSDADFLE